MFMLEGGRGDMGKITCNTVTFMLFVLMHLICVLIVSLVFTFSERVVYSYAKWPPPFGFQS